MINKRICVRSLRLQIEVDVPNLIKVKSYKRIHNGKKEQVRSYYKRTWGAKTVVMRISTR